jgi:hypothetical protein
MARSSESEVESSASSRVEVEEGRAQKLPLSSLEQTDDLKGRRVQRTS